MQLEKCVGTIYGELITGVENRNKTWKQNPNMAFCRQRCIFENMFTLSDTIRIRSSSFTNISTSSIIREVADRMNGVSLPTSQSSTPSLQLCDHLLSDKGPGQRGKILANVQNILTNNLQKALHIEEDIGKFWNHFDYNYIFFGTRWIWSFIFFWQDIN